MGRGRLPNSSIPVRAFDNDIETDNDKTATYETNEALKGRNDTKNGSNTPVTHETNKELEVNVRDNGATLEKLVVS